jgi:hypothetical protein
VEGPSRRSEVVVGTVCGGGAHRDAKRRDGQCHDHHTDMSSEPRERERSREGVYLAVTSSRHHSHLNPPR